ncbi:MAG: tRNA adenosine(34) deaminase TadA [Coriobacteriales bacterium]
MQEPHDERFMRLALEEARAAAAEGEVPVGAVVVRDGEVLATGRNRREADFDPSGHAELIAMRDACAAIENWRLEGCTVYVTLEPCIMCAGAMVNARIHRCVVGALDPKAGGLDSLYAIGDDPRLNHRFDVTYGVLGDECQAVLDGFFGNMRER